MAEAPFIATPLADLDTQRSFAPSEKSGEGIFIPTSVKFAAVTAALWIGLISVAAACWYSAWSVGVWFTRWMGS